MTNSIIEKQAHSMRQELGGRIFAFPVEEDNPFSKYAVVVYLGGSYHIYPEASTIEEAAIGVKTILEEAEKSGYNLQFEKDVRFVSYDAQMNAPSVTMRRLKKGNASKPAFEDGVDVMKQKEIDDYVISARGMIKFSYLSMVDDNMPKGYQFMEEYYKLLSMRRYGKTAAAIKREVRRMTKDEAIKWIERTYDRYIKDSSEIINIMQSLNGKTSSH